VAGDQGRIVRSPPRRRVAAGLAILGIFVVTGCSKPTTLAITSPSDGATVRPPFAVAVAVSGFKLQLAAQAESGVGHLHVIIDHPCIPPGKPIPAGDQYIHLWRGESVTQLDLPPGDHTLCVEAGDGEHTALPLSDRVSLNVVATSTST
jgi:hypothetical protein